MVGLNIKDNTPEESSLNIKFIEDVLNEKIVTIAVRIADEKIISLYFKHNGDYIVEVKDRITFKKYDSYTYTCSNLEVAINRFNNYLENAKHKKIH